MEIDKKAGSADGEADEGENRVELVGDCDLWDDSLLIKAYDRAMRMAKEDVAREKEAERRSQQLVGDKLKQQARTLRAGQKCLAKYADDGMYYEATVMDVSQDKDQFTVEFTGYGNLQRTPAVDLCPLSAKASSNVAGLTAKGAPPSLKPTKLSPQPEPEPGEILAQEEEEAKQTTTTPTVRTDPQRQHPAQPTAHPSDDAAHGVPFPEIQAPLGLKCPIKDEAFASMLCSWYMSGFYTGYYKGLTSAEQATRQDACAEHEPGTEDNR